MPVARGILYAATAGALAVVARSILFSPVSLIVSIALFVGYFGLVMCGVVFLRLGMFVDVTWRGPDDARGVALTFDDGPSSKHTPRVLDLLDEAGVKATFFVIGKKAEKHPEIVREIVRRGHAIGMHSYAHDRLFSLRSPRVLREDMTKALSVLETITGNKTHLFRPPIGHSNPRIARQVDDLDLAVVGWSIRALDGVRGSKPDRIAARVIPRLRDGAIVLLHDAAERDDYEPPGIDALPSILRALKERGLEGVRVDGWIPAD